MPKASTSSHWRRSANRNAAPSRSPLASAALIITRSRVIGDGRALRRGCSAAESDTFDELPASQGRR